MAPKRPRLRSGFTLGGLQAEADPLSETAFLESGDYDVVASRKDPRCFLVGRTGSGKSALLQHLEEQLPEHVVRINPEDLSLPYVTDLQIIRYMDNLGVNLDLFWFALWKHVLLVEIIRHRYQITSPQAKQNFLAGLRDKIKRDPAKQAALDYVDQFQGRFWCETDERVREIVDDFTDKVTKNGSVTLEQPGLASATLSRSSVDVESTSIRTEEAARFQRIVNETQLARLNQMVKVLDDDILNEPQHFTYVLIDDLDRAWVDERIANDLIRCLFRAVLDLKRVSNLKVLVALRTNIFQELDFGRRSGGQEEKLRALVLNMRWTRSTLLELLETRFQVAGPEYDLSTGMLSDILPNTNRTRGNPLDYMLDRTLMRPRDAIAFINECLAVGVGKARLAWNDIQSAERSYSSNRLLALRDEWKETYPGVAEVVDVFRGAPLRMSRDEFSARLDDIMMFLSNENFPGVRWLSERSVAMWNSTADTPWGEIYGPLTELLFEIGLIGCSTGASRAPTFYTDDPLLLESGNVIDTIESLYIHRAYQLALSTKSDRPDEPLLIGA